MTQDKTDPTRDILVIGSGMAGLTFAALAAQQGFSVTVVDRTHPGVLAGEGHDLRTVALSAGSRDIILPLGIWEDIVAQAQAITSIDVQEGHDPFILSFQAAETSNAAFGWIFPNTVVRQALYNKAQNLGVQFIAPDGLKNIQYQPNEVTAILQSGRVVTATLLVGADGRQSRVRDLIGVQGVNIDYHHTAMVGLVAHEWPHQGLAVERFYPTGPFAVLPFTDDAAGRHRSAIVWSRDTPPLSSPRSPLSSPRRRGSESDSLFQGNDTNEAITAQLTPLFDARYGRIEAIGQWARYPLSLFHAKQMVARRVALISDAAHAIHPIAGQGLNLGLRDVAILVEELFHARQQGEDIGSQFLLDSYQQRRRFDVFAMVAATDILNRLFGHKSRSVARLRSLGLGMVDRIAPLKRFFANTAMGK